MASKYDVNQPPIEIDEETGQFKITPYLEDYFFQFVADFGGEGSSPIPALISASSRKADTLLFALLDKVSLGNPVKIDTTGFTIDNTVFTIDMTES